MFFFLFPVFYFLFGASGVAGFKFEPGVLLNPQNVNVILFTFGYSIVGAFLTVGFAFAYSYFVVRTDIPGKRILGTVVVLGIAMPEFAKALGFEFLLSPRIGLINIALDHVFGRPIFNINSFWGLIFAFGVSGAPIFSLLFMPVFSSMDHTLEEASRTMGVSHFKTFFKITGPILLPSFASAMILSTLTLLTNFDFPAVIASTGGFRTLSTLVDFYSTGTVPPNDNAAATIGMLFVFTTFAIFGLYLYLTRNLSRFVTITGTRSYQTIHRLRRWRWPSFLYCVFFFMFGFVLPLLILLWMAFTPYAGSLSASLYWGASNFNAAWHLTLFWTSIKNSLILGVETVAIGVPLALILAYAGLRSKVKGSRIFDFAASIPLAFGGIVYGVALLLTFLFAPGLNLFYGTTIPLVIATVFSFFPTSSRIFSANIMQMGKELEEASRVCGASFLGTIWKVVLPTIKKALFNGAFLFLANSVRDLGSVILLVTPGTILVLPLLLNLYSETASSLPVVAAATVITSGVLTLVLVVFRIAERIIGGR
jgi:iron(III) transport system permease protein